MKAHTILQEMARQVRGGTLQILTAARPEWLTYAPPGTSNHILWHAGHALWLQDVLCIQLLAGHSELPDQWSQSFGMNCRPVRETRDWPSREALVDLLQQQRNRILTLLTQASDEELNRSAHPARDTDSVASRIIHGLHDEAKHAGEMYLLYKQASVR